MVLAMETCFNPDPFYEQLFLNNLFLQLLELWMLCSLQVEVWLFAVFWHGLLAHKGNRLLCCVFEHYALYVVNAAPIQKRPFFLVYPEHTCRKAVHLQQRCPNMSLLFLQLPVLLPLFVHQYILNHGNTVPFGR